jgi:hypothetical protein
MEWAQELIAIGYSVDLIGAVIAEQMIYEGNDFQSFKDMMMATIEAADMGDSYPVAHYAQGLSQNRVTSPGATGTGAGSGTPPTPRPSFSNSVMTLSVGASSWTESTQSIDYKESLATSSGQASSNLAEENRELKDRKNCKICYEKDANMVFLPCGHLVVCETCSSRIRECPLCRRPIDGVLKAYLS